MSFTIGSLFDGSGGFPLAAFMCGGVPVWASEVEPYPIAVTKTRFPYMKHLGSVTDINGAEIEPVDVISFGSPCQDLSVAGKRAGLKHEANGDEETTRSGLFMEAVRIIKEMKEATNGVYPRFALWENVPGAFSSNKGEDFRIVLEELIKIVEPTAVMPPVPKNGWSYADHYCGDGWSLAYRVLDAQHWGVPQRRKRIYLVLDLGGQCAGEVLFERQGLRGYFEEGRTPWQAVAGDAEGGSGTADCEGNSIAYSFDSLASNSMKSKNPHSGCRQVEIAKTLDTTDPNPYKNQGGIAVLQPVAFADVAATLRAGAGAPKHEADFVGRLVGQPILKSAGFCTEHSAKSRGIGFQEEVAPTLRAGVTPAVACKCYDARGNGDGSICPTITGDHNNRVTDYTSIVCEPVAYNGENITSPLNKTDPQPGDPCHTLGTDSRNYLVYCLQGNGIDRADTAGCNGKGWKEDVSYTLNTIDRPAVAYGIGNGQANQSFMEECTGALNCMHDQQAIAYGVDARNATEYPELNDKYDAYAWQWYVSEIEFK
jgi:DNA (cytosine-5)-methyltransferase 1